VRGPGSSAPERGRRLSDAPSTLPELFRRAFPPDPDRAPFLEVPGGAGFTYADLDRITAQLAHSLAAAGVHAGDRVAVQAEKSPAFLFLYLACVRAGAVLVPMNTAYTRDEVAHLVADADPALVVDDARLGELGVDARTRASAFDDVVVGPDDLAAILYTSGTTGKPKGAMLSHRNLATNAAVLHRLWGFTPDDVLLHVLPVFHTHGLFVAVNCVLANGTGMVFLPRFDVDEVVRALPRCTVLMGVPTHYTRLLGDERFGAGTCAGMRLFVSGSAPMLASTHAAFHDRTGHTILERYGMTETSMLTSNPLDGERRPGTVGRPVPGTDLRLAGDGTIEVRGPNVFGGYWRRPDLAGTEFSADGWFRTGDIGSIDADGYVRIIGRAKDLVISGGLNVYPKEVEDVVDAIEGVLESAVIGVPDPDLGEAVVAVVVEQPGHVIDPARVRDAARERLAGFKVPRRVEVVEALPRNAMGKVEKAVLRARFS
jgi:malonyl-CoA/methylmalonyl-CoA synthetase